MTTTCTWDSVGSAVHLSKSAHQHFTCASGLASSTPCRLPLWRQQQACVSSTMSSATSGTAGLLVRHLCKESDSCTPCHGTDSTYNGKPCNMSSCRTLPLSSYSTYITDGALLCGLLCLFIYLFLWLCGQQQGLNETENTRGRSRQNNACICG